MKNFYKIALLLVLGMATIAVSCNKEEKMVAKAVLASASSLKFDGTDAVPQMITVYSDAEWVADVPEWVTIDPTTGSGTVDVIISVTDNLREGALDRPRKADIVFRGNTLASRAVVAVSQDGDKYRDVGNSTVSEVVAAADETVVLVPDAQIAALAETGVIVTDGKSNLFVSADTDNLKIGDKVSFNGTKVSEGGLPSVLECDEFQKISEGELNAGTPVDITASIDTYTSDKRSYVVVKGVLRGTNIQIASAELRSVNIVSPHSSIDISSINGHRVIAKGYYSGETTSYVNLIISEITSEGPAEIIYWFDDFSWVTDYAEAYKATGGTSTKPTVDDCVKDKLSTDKGCPNIYTDCVNLGVNVLQALRDKGYEDLNPSMKTIYMQMHYFKYGATNKQSGLVLPPFAEGVEIQNEVIVSFDWCGYMASSGKIDVAEMVVKIDGPGYVVTASGSESAKVSDKMSTRQSEGELFWMTETVVIRDASAETRITISPAFIDGDETPSDDKTSTYMRYYMDNIKVYSEINQD